MTDLKKCECQWDAHFGSRVIRHTIAHPYLQEFEETVPVQTMPEGPTFQKCEMCAQHHTLAGLMDRVPARERKETR